jgi:putative membrane protein
MMKKALIRLVLLALAFLIVTHPALGLGVTLTGFWGALWAAIAFSILNLLVSPVAWLIRLIAFPITLLTLGIASLVISLLTNVFIFWVMSTMHWGIHVESTIGYLIGPLLLSIVNSILNVVARMFEGKQDA